MGSIIPENGGTAILLLAIPLFAKGEDWALLQRGTLPHSIAPLQ